MNRAFASAIIVCCLGAQAAAALGPIEMFAWPFTNYPMYRRPHVAGEPVLRMDAIGVTEDGREVPLTPEFFRTNRWIIERSLLRSLRQLARDPQDVEARRRVHAFHTMFRQRDGGRLRRVRLFEEELQVEQGRPVTRPARVVLEMAWPAEDP